MTTYHYCALDKQGKQIRGVADADSPRQVRHDLRHQGLTPLGVNPIINNTTKFMPRGKKIKVAELALLTRQLATLLSAGLPIEESLAATAEQIEKAQIKTVVLGVRAKVLEGLSLSQALAFFPHAFPELYCATIGAGEQTGKLDTVLERLADHIEQQQSIRQKVRQALIYPALMTLVSIGIVSFLLIYVVPKIINVFKNTGQSLPEMTHLLLDISAFAQHDGVYLLIFIFIAALIWRQLMQHKTIKYKWHQLLLKIPLISYAIKTLNTARYARTFGILNSAGVPVLEAMRVSSSLITNLPMQATISVASERVREGATINFALKQTGYFSPLSLHLISSGEASGQLADMLERAANNQDNEMSRMIDTGLSLFEPMIILLMGSVVLFIVLAILLPIFALDQFTG